jgi:phosphohistidine phosphatase SixA
MWLLALACADLEQGPAASSAASRVAGADHHADWADTAAPLYDPQGELTVVYLVRHAEKDSGSDPGLTEQGAARALKGAEELQHVHFDAIYATSYRRTRETVAPSAAMRGMPIGVDLDPEDELAQHILDNHVGDTILHSGHSFTVKDFMDALGLQDVPNVSGYGQLWTLRIDAEGVVYVDETRFGDPE